MMKGYLRIEDPNHVEPPAAKDEHGNIQFDWFDTGDIVSIDEQGFCTILGQGKHFAKQEKIVSLESEAEQE